MTSDAAKEHTPASSFLQERAVDVAKKKIA
jgi:hypothetical protein